MTDNKKPNNRQINLGEKGNYNEEIGRDYIQGNVYNNCHISISQEAKEQTSANSSESQQQHNSSTVESELTINSSEKWALIGKHFFKYETVRRHPDDILTINIPSDNPEDDALIESLRPERFRSNTIPFAYRNDGFFVNVESIEAQDRENDYIWTINLKPEDIEYGGSYMESSLQTHDCYYNPAEIAELRGRRILLNNPPKQNSNYFPLSDESILESFISRPINNNNIQINDCILQQLYPQFKDKPKNFLELSRLAAIFYLKAGDVVEQILELSLRLIEPDKIHVKFRGKRRKRASNVEPVVIEIEGICSLE
jgi:hypothetical protein